MESDILGNTCSFFGHRDIEITDALVNQIESIVVNLIENNSVERFLFGSKSMFNDLCHKIVTELKNKYSNIIRVAYPCVSEDPVLEKDKVELENSCSKVLGTKVSLQTYDEIVENEKIWRAGKSAYIQRNYKMIEDSDFCVFYYSLAYIPKEKTRCNKMIYYQPKSGTKLAYDYAIKKNKNVIKIN